MLQRPRPRTSRASVLALSVASTVKLHGRVEADISSVSLLLQVPSGSKTIILHPGSGTLRIGRATDYAPKELPMALARRRIGELNGADSNGSQARNGVNGKGKEREQDEGGMEVNEAQPLDEVRLAPIVFERPVLIFPPRPSSGCPGRPANRLSSISSPVPNRSAPVALIPRRTVPRLKLQLRRAPDQDQGLQRSLPGRMARVGRRVGRYWGSGRSGAWGGRVGDWQAARRARV